MKAVSVPWEERSFFSKYFYIPRGFFVFCFLRIISTWSKMAKSRAFAFSNGKYFSNTESSALLLKMVSKIFFPSVFASWEDILVKVKVFYFPLYVPGCRAESDGVQRASHSAVGAPLCCGWVICPLSPFVKTACMQPSRRTMRVLPAPYNATPATTSHQHRQSYYLLASHQQPRSTEKMNVAVLNQPKMQRKVSLPRQREREWGKEWAKPESSGALPKPLEACDRSLFQRNRLPVSYPFLNCKWQQQLPNVGMQPST